MKSEKIKKPLLNVLFIVGVIAAILRNHEIISRIVADIVMGSVLIGLIIHMILFRNEKKVSSDKEN